MSISLFKALQSIEWLGQSKTIWHLLLSAKFMLIAAFEQSHFVFLNAFEDFIFIDIYSFYK